MNLNDLYEERASELALYFKQQGMANSIEPTDSQSKDLPGCYLMPLTVDAAPSIYNDTGPQREDEFFGVVIIHKLELLDEARRHVKQTFRGFIPPSSDLEYYPIEYVGGELKNLQTNVVVWTETYKTYTLGGC